MEFRIELTISCIVVRPTIAGRFQEPLTLWLNKRIWSDDPHDRLNLVYGVWWNQLYCVFGRQPDAGVVQRNAEAIVDAIELATKNLREFVGDD